MSCIKANIEVLPLALGTSVSVGNDIGAVQVTNLCASPNVSVQAEDGLDADISLLRTPIIVGITDEGQHLKAYCSIVCSIGVPDGPGELPIVKYLRVLPDEVQWITDDMGVFFDVESNTEWIVENI